MVIDVNLAYRDDHFTIYAGIESLCFTPETNIVIYLKKKKN